MAVQVRLVTSILIGFLLSWPALADNVAFQGTQTSPDGTLLEGRSALGPKSGCQLINHDDGDRKYLEAKLDYPFGPLHFDVQDNHLLFNGSEEVKNRRISNANFFRQESNASVVTASARSDGKNRTVTITILNTRNSFAYTMPIARMPQGMKIVIRLTDGKITGFSEQIKPWPKRPSIVQEKWVKQNDGFYLIGNCGPEEQKTRLGSYLLDNSVRAMN